MLFESEVEAVLRYLLAMHRSELLCGTDSRSQDSLEATDFTLDVHFRLNTRPPGIGRIFRLLILPFLSC